MQKSITRDRYALVNPNNGKVYWSNVSTVPNNATSFVGTGLDMTTSYRIRIAATNAFGSSPYSDPIFANTSSGMPCNCYIQTTKIN